MKRVNDCAFLICAADSTIRDAIRRVDGSTPLLFQIVVDTGGKVVGSITDGDIRRGFARGLRLEDSVRKCMHTPPVVGRIGDTVRNAELLHGRRFLPICDARGVLDHVIVEHIGPRRVERALIMAGGFGTRLGERTKTTPKPLLPVGGKPILEHILARLEEYGIQKVEISVHYLAEQIQDFVTKRNNNCDIELVRETEPLGTAGSLSLIGKPTIEPILVMNADVLTDVDFGAMVEHHARVDCDGTIAAHRFEYQVPYGVLRFDDSDILQGIDEKPTYYHLVSAGIYYLDPVIVGMVPKGRRMDVPELLELATASGCRLSVFPVHEYWSDVGQPKDLDAAGDRLRRQAEGTKS
ncbi:NTP transferase domain-containing protein [Rhodospirillaceae bacterium KN72]|uniref:NTP transferase domain-containing protein n=1 Tax=Pacificispira spongiicola TaxID=2729598 RepID=A0A7Y0E1M5_9PROT|nr:nucleotidyltransferase family protein [Pacificispira spongiicola]NMM45580.1 NTP transferase domain-containing protein [Pacificispira spongiicola]